jgi:hypothetical protein
MLNWKDKETLRLYHVWRQMHRRCSDPQNKSYANYGGRGIYVCIRWIAFAAFIDDMGPRPLGYVLDRIDNNGSYTPVNCRWATRQVSNANRRWAILIDGKTLKEYMRDTGQLDRYRMVTKRIKRGIPIADALAMPSRFA